ncbi:MAG: YeaH/YhbH family protein [Pseudomonadota bacterium]|nr:YeaH/YhbH family protein [Pseudomonadota bacterium]
MQQIIDRRLAGKNKSIGNRERFLRRYQDQLREAVKKAVDKRGIRDIEQGEDIHLPRRDISEPVFSHGSGGAREMVHPGNQDYMRGDRIERPRGGGSRGSGGQAGDSEGGEDDFVFHLTKEEFMQIFFDDLALPRMTRTQLAEMPEMKSQRAGYASSGNPSNLSVIRSMRGAIGRRVAIGSGSRAELAELEARLAALPGGPLDAAGELVRTELEAQIEALRLRLDRIPYLDPIDLRFRNRVRQPVPLAKAVMFCLMDVSGSMDEARKDLAKRFFILLYLFLTRHYQKIEIVFIRHHTQAQEVDEENFFRARETGGTVVSSALVLMDEIIRARYSPTDWNIYGAQASDGDNWHHDSGRCRELLTDSLLPKCRYFAYVQVAEEEQNLWEEYARLQEVERHFAMRKVTQAAQIYPVFRDLFKSEAKAA